LNANAVAVFACLLQFAGCTSMAPGIQFAKAPTADTRAADHPRTEIRTITPDLVREERELRDQQVAEDIGALLQPAQVYRIEAGDVLHIVVWDHPELSASMLPAPPLGAAAVAGVAVSPLQPQSGFEVDHQGMLDFPYAGKLKVAGLTPSDLHQQLTERLARYLRNPKLSVRVLAYRSKRVYVDGEVKQPGVQAINDLPMTLTEAINRAGGMNPTADQSRIIIHRDGKSYPINLPQLVQRGVNPASIMLTSGDVVRVLSRDESKIFISGEVTSPRALPMRNGRLTLNEALGEAGGINPVTGDARQVYVIRRSSAKSMVYQLDANAPGALAMAEGFELNPKDVVYVAATPLTNWNRTISALIPGALPTAVIATTPGR
jgi:polysaccharide export outer membrane protein